MALNKPKRIRIIYGPTEWVDCKGEVINEYENTYHIKFKHHRFDVWSEVEMRKNQVEVIE